MVRARSEKSFKVMVVLNGNLKPDQGHIAGILRYEAMRHDWNCLLLSDHPSNQIFNDLSNWRPDGIIVSDYMLERGFRPQPRHRPKAIVAVMSPRRATPFPGVRFASVNLDNGEIGASAARLLVKKGFRNFGFIGTPHVRRWSDERLAGFAGELSKSGFACNTYDAGEPPPGEKLPWGVEQRRLAAWLEALPKPCGIMASYDQRAKHTLDACRLCGIQVPGQIGVISVDNEVFLCEHTRPSLTSIVPEFESCGYRAAELLDLLMRGGRSRNAPELFGVQGIVERLSTADFSGAVRIVESAREFMRINFAAEISCTDVADAAGVSVRVLEKRFMSALGKSPSDELRDIRLRHVKEALTGSDTPIKEIGWQCGFKSEIHLKDVFRRRFGMSMREWRKSSRITSHEAVSCATPAQAKLKKTLRKTLGKSQTSR